MGLQVSLQNISKKYSNHFVIKNYSYEFADGSSYAILGSNGSGKSTFIKLLSGLHSPSKGEVVYQYEGRKLPVENVFKNISLAAPWSDVIEELTFNECLNFHFKFREPLTGLNIGDIKLLSGLESSSHKLIHQFSSGMKQRVRLILAITTQSNLLLLDEPTSNLDAEGKLWYRMLVGKFTSNRTTVVASNHILDEYDFCKNIIDLSSEKN